MRLPTRRGSRFRSPGGSHSDDWFIDNDPVTTQVMGACAKTSG